MECAYYKSWDLTPHWPVLNFCTSIWWPFISTCLWRLNQWFDGISCGWAMEYVSHALGGLQIIVDAKLIKYVNLCKGTQWMTWFTLHRYWIPKKSDTCPHGDQPNHLHVFLVYNEKHTSWSFHGVWIKAALLKLEDYRFTCLHKLICLFLSNYGSYLMLWLLLF